jgi:bacterioferritin
MSAPPKASDELKKLLNEAIAREISVSISYMWQHVLMIGFKGFAVRGEIKKISISEMKHAEEIAERLVYLGGMPTTKPTEIRVGESLKEMIKINAEQEAGAIELYRKIIAKAEEEGDTVTADMFHEILAQEEEHHDTFTKLLRDA